MSAEKTEKATPKRLQKERSKGNISKSQDLNSALVLTLGTCLLFTYGINILEELKILLHITFANFIAQKLYFKDITGFFMPYIMSLTRSLVPFLLILMFFAGFLVRMQVGALFAIEKLKPSIDKLTPSAIVNGLKRMFNPFAPKNLFELGKSFLKLAIIGSVGYSSVINKKDDLLSLLGADIMTGMTILSDVLFHVLINMCIIMIILGLIDKKYQDYEYDKSIKMTKQEVKDEMKNSDGDPKIKSKIKAQQMQIMNQKMMSAIPKADVVVTNPTHYAVAIKYDKINNPAPIVVAKGVDFMAFKIREIATNNNIPIVENKPLARSLYKLVKVNGIIPEELYTATAEVLAWVYNRNKVLNR